MMLKKKGKKNTQRGERGCTVCRSLHPINSHRGASDRAALAGCARVRDRPVSVSPANRCPVYLRGAMLARIVLSLFLRHPLSFGPTWLLSGRGIALSLADAHFPSLLLGLGSTGWTRRGNTVHRQACAAPSCVQVSSRSREFPSRCVLRKARSL